MDPITARNKDCFDENDGELTALLSEKHKLLRAHQNDPVSKPKKAAFLRIRRNVQMKLRQMQDSWYNMKADEIQKTLTTTTSNAFMMLLKNYMDLSLEAHHLS